MTLVLVNCFISVWSIYCMCQIPKSCMGCQPLCDSEITSTVKMAAAPSRCSRICLFLLFAVWCQRTAGCRAETAAAAEETTSKGWEHTRAAIFCDAMQPRLQLMALLFQTAIAAPKRHLNFQEHIIAFTFETVCDVTVGTCLSIFT